MILSTQQTQRPFKFCIMETYQGYNYILLNLSMNNLVIKFETTDKGPLCV